MPVTLKYNGFKLVDEEFPDDVTYEEIATRSAMLMNQDRANQILGDEEFKEWRKKENLEKFFELGASYSLVYPASLRIVDIRPNIGRDNLDVVKGQPLQPGAELSATVDTGVKTKLHPDYDGAPMNGSQKVEFAVDNFQTTELGCQAYMDSVKRGNPMHANELMACAETVFLNASQGKDSEGKKFGTKLELEFHHENPKQGRFIGGDIIATKIMDACIKLSPVLKQEQHFARAEENFKNQETPNEAGLRWLVEKRAELDKEKADEERRAEIKRQVEAKKQEARDRVAQYAKERTAQGKSSYGADTYVADNAPGASSAA